MKKTATLLTLVCALAIASAAQKESKPWMEWTKKDVEKMLNDSPWGQTQVLTDTSEMTFQPTQTGGRNDSQRAAIGATNQAIEVKFRIRFFSARPIRQALARQMMLNTPNIDNNMVERLRAFAELQSNEKIIVAAGYETRDGRYGGAVMQIFNGATTATLKNTTYLKRKDGRQVFLEEYVPPGKDGFGARFIFPRVVDGRPFLTAETGEVRFVSDLGRNLELNMRFNVAKMMHDGELEY